MAVLNAASVLMMAMALPARTQLEQRLVAERRERAHATSAAGHDEGATSAPASNSATLRSLLCRPRMVAFLVQLMLLGCGFTVVEKFLFVFALNELGADSALCGYSVAATVVFEIPIFQFGALLVDKLGHDAMMWLATASYVARVFGYTRLQPHTVWYLLALEPFHGITYGLAWTAAVDKMKRECPEEWQTTGQLLLNTCMWSVGRTTGALFGGFFYHHGALLGLHGGRALYLASCFGGLAVLAVHTAITLALRFCGMRGLHTPPLPPPAVTVAPLPSDEGNCVGTDTRSEGVLENEQPWPPSAGRAGVAEGAVSERTEPSDSSKGRIN